MWEIIEKTGTVFFWIFILVLLLVAKPLIRYAFDYFWPKATRTGKKEAEQMAEVYSDLHEFKQVTPQEFPGKSLEFYESTQRFLEEQGFRWVGDIEDLTLSRTHPKMRTFIRCMISNDGTVSGGIYDVELKGWMKLLQLIGLLPKKLQVLELETEFNDGTFLSTSNSKGLDQLDSAPAVRKIQYPQETDLMDILNIHRGLLAQWCGADPDYRPQPITSMEDIIAAQHRGQEIQNAFRHEIGLLSPEELQRMSGGNANPFDLEQILKEHNKLASGELKVSKPNQSHDR